MAQLQAPSMLLVAIYFLFMCAEGRLVPTPCWQDPNCREDPHPPRQRAELTPEVVEPNRLVPTPCWHDLHCCEDPHPPGRDPTSMTEVFEPRTRLLVAPSWQDPNCREDPRPPGYDPASTTEVFEPNSLVTNQPGLIQVQFEPNRLVPIPCWQDPNCREDPYPPGRPTSFKKEVV